MKRLSFKLFLFFLAAYFLLTLVFASSAVQNKIKAELVSLTEPQGIQLNFENIDVSFITPKIYLNKVSLKTNSKSLVELPDPILIERVKIQINPLSLIWGQLTLSEVSLFQPKIVIDKADQLYKRLVKALQTQSKWKVKGGHFNIEIEKVGVVDAYVLVTVSGPKIGLDSGRFTLFVEKSAKDQFTVTSNFSNLKLERGTFQTVIRTADFDLDVTSKSIRANKVNVESDWISLNLKGAAALPFSVSQGPESFRAVYDLRASLSALERIEEFKGKLPKDVSGVLVSSGNLEKAGRGYLGTGKLSIKELVWNGLQLDNGQVGFTADGKKASLKDLVLSVEDGKIKSDKMVVEFKDRYPFSGEFSFEKVEINQLLKRLKVKQNPLYVAFNGHSKVNGFLESPFALNGEVACDLNNLLVVSHVGQPKTPENTVINISEGKLTSTFNTDGKKGEFKSQIQMLEGVLVSFGTWSENSPLEVQVDAKGLSLTRLGMIQQLPFGGIANLKAKIRTVKGEPIVTGDFDLQNGEIAEVVLGAVRGSAHYENDLLVFESLELPSLEAIKSEGFVDFKPKETRYKFNISSNRASVDQVFQFFRKTKLDFTPPTGGDVAAKVVLEGGHDDKGIEVTATGKVRGISWYDEKWLAGSIALVYRNDFVKISRATLTKPRGALGFQGFFRGKQSQLQLKSYGLKLEDLDRFKGAPISGEIVGQVKLEGDLSHPNGQGELKLIKSFYRNQSLGDSNISIRETPSKTEFLGNLFGQSLQGRLVTIRRENQPVSEVMLNFKNCDLLPLVSMWSGKELPAFGSIRATGDLELEGNLNNWDSVSGAGSLADIVVDLKTAPVKNSSPVAFMIEKGAIKIPPFELVGRDSLVSGYIEVKPGQSIKAGLDSKLDLIYLQPFIPGLEYGTGKVTAGLRVSGNLPKFDMLGNIAIEDGSFRIRNLAEDFRNVRTQMSLTQDNINIDRFEATHGGGNIQIKGGVRIDRFKSFSPDLQLVARGVGFKQQNYLKLKVSGDLSLKGKEFPYLLSGDCRIDEGVLSDFNITPSNSSDSTSLRFNLRCIAEKGFIVDTEVMQAEWKGDFNLVGDNSKLGLLGAAESIKGTVFFKETKFSLVSGNVRFESREKINPRFNVSAKSFVKEQRAQVPIEYEVNLSAYGTPQDYKIRLSSVPALAEPDLIALLVLGVTTRGQDDNYLDFGSTLVGKSPLQSKLQNELGVNIKVNMQRTGTGPSGSSQTGQGSQGASGGSTGLPSGSTVNNSDATVPALKIQKDITNKTKLSYSSTLDQNAMKEFKIEQLLDENFTVNASAVDKIRGTTQNDSVKSYGLDFRYRFQFE